MQKNNPFLLSILQFTVSALLFMHCSEAPAPTPSGLCTFKVLDFSITLPCNAQHETLKSIDSQAGTFVWNNYTLIYDKMNTEIPVKCISDSVYLAEKRWLYDAIHILPLEKNVEYSVNSLVEKIEVVDLDIRNKKAVLQYEKQRYEYKIPIPEEILNTRYVHDSINGESVLFKIEKHPDSTHFKVQMYTSSKKDGIRYFIYRCNGTTFSIQNVRRTDSIYVMERLKSISCLR